MISNHRFLTVVKFILPLVMLVVLTGRPASCDTKADDTVAFVNGTKLSRTALDQEVSAIQQRMQMGGQTLSAEQSSELQGTVLDRMIDRELLFQASKKEGVKIEEKSISEEIAKFKGQFPSDEAFKETLTNMQLTEEDLKGEFGRGLAIQEFVEKSIISKIAVSDDDIKKFYDENKDEFRQAEQVRASHILVSIAENADEATKKAAREKIVDLQKQIKGGADFAELAKTNSQCPSSAMGGDLGYFTKGRMVKPFEDAAFGLKNGEVSDIVETNFGFHLIKVTDRKEESMQKYDDVKERIGDFLKQQKGQERIEGYLAETRKGAKIEKKLETAAN
jgi:peptidyl-prolyl cis-trans isomerase C